MATPRRLSSPNLPYSEKEILSHIREASDSEASLVASYMYEAMDRIETVCERAVTMTRYELVISAVPYGVDNTVGPQPFSQNKQYPSVSSSYWRDSEFGVQYPPAIMLEMPPIKSVISVQYYDVAGDLQTWSDWQFMADEPGYLFPQPEESYPTHQNRRDALRIEFWAGETDELSWDGGETFTSLSGCPVADGDTIVLRASGNKNSFLASSLCGVATVPTGFNDGGTYYVVNSTGPTFQLSLTDGGTAITGSLPAGQKVIDKLYAGRMFGTTAAGVRKIALDSYAQRCSAGECSCSGSDDPFMNDPLLRRMMWRSPVQF